MKKSLFNGGVLMLVLIFFTIEAFVPVFPNLKSTHLLSGKASQWLIWGVWGWLTLNVIISLRMGRRTLPRWEFSCAFSLEWAQALLPLALGALVVMLGGETRQGAAMAWLSLPWAALLVWQTVKRSKT